MQEQLYSIFSEIIFFDPNTPLFFTRLSFGVLLCFILLGFSFVYKQSAIKNGYLLFFSLFIYYQMSGAFLILLILSCLFNFSIGLLSYKQKNGKLWLIIGLCVNILFLIYYKYAYFLTNSINKLSSEEYLVFDWFASLSNTLFSTSFNTETIILPIGISFFTFQAIAYIVDCYKRKIEPIRNIIDFSFFLTFFPQLVAGPIMRATAFIPQLHSKYKLRDTEFSHALYLIAKGLVKKILLADFLAYKLVDNVFDAPWAYSGLENLAALYAYAAQIYFDFSGYTDIALGIALLFGFKLPINFNSPYHAKSLTKFWRCWHISLSTWLRDYIYIPMGGNRKGSVRSFVNIILTMLIGGLWHGANWKFIIWGGIHGLGLVIEKLLHPLTSRIKSSAINRIWQRLLTFHIVLFAWLFFRASDTESIHVMLHQIGKNFSPNFLPDEWESYIPVGLMLMISYLIIMCPAPTKEKLRGIFIRQNIVSKILIILTALAVTYLISNKNDSTFIYFQF